MKTSQFGSKELCNCLEKLGFEKNPQKATSHLKYKISIKNYPNGVMPFIIVILGRKSYDPNTRASYLSQISRLGFSKEEIIKFLK